MMGLVARQHEHELAHPLARGHIEQGDEANPVSPTTDDFTDAAELVDAVGPVESRQMAIFTAAHVICRARMRGLVQGLQHNVRNQQGCR